jgi:hypothetical protein
MFSASEDEMRTPPEIMEMLKIPTSNLLPKKFRDRYECLSNIYELERKEYLTLNPFQRMYSLSFLAQVLSSFLIGGLCFWGLFSLLLAF